MQKEVEMDELQEKNEPPEKNEPQNIQERTLEFACRIIRLHDHLQQRRGAARSLSKQLLRSGTSIGANLQEADGGESRADFISKCNVALKESRETQYWLRVLANSGTIQTEKLMPLLTESGELVAILTTIVKNSRHPT
jgi:four helix bundle protein